ncbi:acyl-CoA synthetase [Mumia sp. Pv 4-285]|uniref:acyl-CoA synthetase n=1 Tax=Mumia qirimensis TaxID=3234852 RepID=UPI00351D8C0C
MHLTHALHQTVVSAPDAPLTRCGDRVRTAREVADRVAHLAGGLGELGVEEGDRVSVLAANSDRHHEVFLATWWCGAAINPVNVRWSAAEIAYSLADCGSRVLFVDDEFLGVLAHPAVRRLDLLVVYCGEGEAPDGMVGYEELISAAEPIEDRRRGDDALAAVLYTGGTTGHPKGVMVSHRGLVTSALTAQVAEPTSVPGGVNLVVAPLFHIAAIQGWITQQLVGGSFVFLRAFDPVAVLAAIARHRVTRTTLVPTMLQRVVDHPDLASYDLRSLHTLGYGASPISEALLARALEAFPNSGFVQGYGMTETGTVTMLGREDHRCRGRRLRSVGRGVPQLEIRVVDEVGQEVPLGEIGQVVVRGDQLMLGYWGRPDLTADAVQDGWMHTGDLGYLDSGGYLFLVDRLKDMIISGGENVYSSEVENALADHPAVAGCAVFGVPDEEWGEVVHAAVVLHDRRSASPDELVAHVRGRIAAYKAPRQVDIVDALPLSSAGKVLKRELRRRSVRSGAAPGIESVTDES